jgi:hypothetical protein
MCEFLCFVWLSAPVYQRRRQRRHGVAFAWVEQTIDLQYVFIGILPEGDTEARTKIGPRGHGGFEERFVPMKRQWPFQAG